MGGQPYLKLGGNIHSSLLVFAWKATFVKIEGRSVFEFL